MLLLSILLIVLGLFLCFRGILLANIIQALLGAIQGLIWGLIIQLILSAFGLLSYVGAIWYFILIVFAVITAYIAAIKEKIYRIIQGITNGLVLGGLISIAAILAVNMAYYFSYNFNSDPSAWTPYLGIALTLFFAYLGWKFYDFFRRLGSLIISYLVALILLCAYVRLPIAALLSLLIVGVFAYILNFLKENLPIIKIAGMGSVMTVTGARYLINDSFLLEDFLSSGQRVLGNITSVNGTMGEELGVPIVAILLLWILGSYVQIKWVQSGAYSSFDLHQYTSMFSSGFGGFLSGIGNALNGIARAIGNSIHSLTSYIKSHTKQLRKFLIGVLCVCVAVGVVFAGIHLYNRWQTIRREDRGTAGIEGIAKAYSEQLTDGNTVNGISFAVESVNYVDDQTAFEGDREGFTIGIDGDISGWITLNGEYNEDEAKEKKTETDGWYTDQINVNIVTPTHYNESILDVFCNVIDVFMNIDYEEARNQLYDPIMYFDESYNYQEYTLGRAGNVYAVISVTPDGLLSLECGLNY